MVDLANLQAIVARDSTKPLLAVLLYKFGDAGQARAFLRQWVPRTAAGMAPDGDGPDFHFMFGWKGIEALMSGRPGFDVAQGRWEFEVFFVDPTQAPDGAVAEQLGFVGDSSPSEWWDGKFASSDVDLAIHIGFDTPEQKADCLAELRRSAATFGVREFTLEGWDDRALSGCRPADGRLHFGYRDGITAPNVDWQDTRVPARWIVAKSSSAIRTRTIPPRRIIPAHGRISHAMAPLSACHGSIRMSRASMNS